MGVGLQSAEGEAIGCLDVRDNCCHDPAIPVLGGAMDTIRAMFGQSDVTCDGHGPIVVPSLVEQFMDVRQHCPGVNVTVLVRFARRNHDNPHLTVVRERDPEGKEAAILDYVLLGSSQGRPQNLPEFALLYSSG